MEEDLATENVEVSGLELAHNHLELRIVQEGRREFRVPFFEAEMRLSEQVPALFEGLPWRVKLGHDHDAAHPGVIDQISDVGRRV